MIPKWLQGKTIAVYDIETPWITSEGTTALDTIYCIGVVTLLNSKVISKKVYTQYWTPYTNGSLQECVVALQQADIRVAFNNVGFDDVVMKNVLGCTLPTISPEWNFPSLDLLIISKICFSKDELFSIDASIGIDKALWGAYSLRAWGARLGNDKMHFDEFDTGLTEAMTKYCLQDCVVTSDLFLNLVTRENFPIEPVVTIEHQAAAIIAQQTEYGFYFDITKGKALNTKLLTEKHELSTKLTSIFKPKWLRDGKEKEYKKKSIVRKYLPNNNYKPLLGTKDTL